MCFCINSHTKKCFKRAHRGIRNENYNALLTNMEGVVIEHRIQKEGDKTITKKRKKSLKRFDDKKIT